MKGKKSPVYQVDSYPEVSGNLAQKVVLLLVPGQLPFGKSWQETSLDWIECEDWGKNCQDWTKAITGGMLLSLRCIIILLVKVSSVWVTDACWKHYYAKEDI